ncbi:MAG: class B sortase [Bacteroides sp.]|nr:class B sortase [Bacteroides sp.]
MAEHVKKSQNAFVRMFIPNKSDSAGAVVRKIIVILCLVVFIACGVYILTDLSSQKADEDMNESLVDMVEMNASGTFKIDQQKVEEIKEEQPDILDKYVDLYAENNDMVGWIKAGHYINYPVMMREGLENTDYYLYRNFYGEDSKSGSIFCDNHVPMEEANNLVLYGHNMQSGEYFAQLTHYYPYSSHYYSDSLGGFDENAFLDYYAQYPTIQFDTLYEEGTYKVFAGIFINTEDKDGYPYPYYRKRQFKSEYEFMDFIGNIMDRSTFYTDVDLEYGDQIITLSTCYYYPMGKNVDARFALFARKVREGESAEVDTSKAYVNPSPLFFDTYYDRGLAYPWKGRSWDVSLVKDFDKYSDKVDSLDNLEPGEAVVTSAAE